MLNVALVQASPALGNKEKNIAKLKKAVEKAGADLAVFPECFLTGYMVRDDLGRLTEGLDGPSIKAVQRVADDCGTIIIMGFPERCKSTRGHVYNSALIAQPGAKPQSYRKLHLANFGPFEEKTHFAQGSEPGLFRTKLGTIGLTICYDIFFPELSKYYALSGADMVVCISASPSTTRVFFEKALVCRAIENTVFTLYSNLAGTELNMVFWGGCQAYGPRGNQIAKGDYFREQTVYAELDLKELEVARRFRPTLKNTRGDLLRRLSATR